MPRQAPPHTLTDLIQAIDAHLAGQMERTGRERSNSKGTMIVDWDGEGTPVISYRGRHHQRDEYASPAHDNIHPSSYRNRVPTRKPVPPSKDKHRNKALPPLPPAPPIPPRNPRRKESVASAELKSPSLPLTEQNLRLVQGLAPPTSATLTPRPSTPNSRIASTYPSSHTRTSTSTAAPPPMLDADIKPRPLVLTGHDRSTNFRYSYDGEIMHVNRPAKRHSADRQSAQSAYSEYWDIDAKKYHDGAEFLVADDEDREQPDERMRQVKVLGVIKRVLKKLDGLGLLDVFRRKRGREVDCERMSELGYRPWVPSVT